MEIATYIGISVRDFWDMTWKEITIMQKSYNERKHDEMKEYEMKYMNQQRLMTIQAYQISRWVWQKKVDIEKILEVKKEKKVMTDEEMLNQVKLLNKIFRGEEK